MKTKFTVLAARSAILAGVLLALAAPARAARPFITDDARLTTAHSCQLESWLRNYRDSHEAWALPACNPGGNLEFTVGGGRTRADGVPVSSDQVFQLKTLFRNLESNDWGWGLAVGTMRHPSLNPGPNGRGNNFAYLPVSKAMLDDRLVLHLNVGWLRDHLSRDNSMTWGLGGEFQATPRLLLIVESFGNDRVRPYWQTGARFAIVPNRVQVDATVGRQFTGPVNTHWMSFGLRITPGAMF